MNTNWKNYLALFILSLYVEHDRAANIGGSHLQNPVKFSSTFLPTSFTMVTSTPIPTQRTTTPGFLVSSGPNNFTVQAGSKITLQCQVDQLTDNATAADLYGKCGPGVKCGSLCDFICSRIVQEIRQFPSHRRAQAARVMISKKIDLAARLGADLKDVSACQFGAKVIEPVQSSSCVALSSGLVNMLAPLLISMPRCDNIRYCKPAGRILWCSDPVSPRVKVSWLRRFGDSLILVSVGKEMYSSDPRFTSFHLSAQDWRLHIDGVNVTDQGHYECQISSHPPLVRSVYLHVLVPKLEIADERSLPIKNKFYNSGSTIELKCVISKVPQPTQFIIWKHNSSILNYDTTRGGISVKTDILPDGAESQLNIANVGPTDSGNYTCSLGESAVTSVTVVVITGETPAAMQQGCSKSRVSLGLLVLALELAVTDLSS